MNKQIHITGLTGEEIKYLIQILTLNKPNQVAGYESIELMHDSLVQKLRSEVYSS